MITTTENITEINTSYLVDELRKAAATNNALIVNFDTVLPEDVPDQAENYITSVTRLSDKTISIQTTTTALNVIVSYSDTQSTLENDRDQVVLIGQPVPYEVDFEPSFAIAVIKYINGVLG